MIYYIVSPAEAKKCFELREKTGDLILLKPLTSPDCNKDRYDIRVRARDLGIPSRESNQIDVIVIVRHNKNTPFFDNLPRGIVIRETDSINRQVYDVNAQDRDRDWDPYRKVEFSLIGDGKASTFFNISSDGGSVRIQQDLRTHTDKTYLLRIQASDFGNPRKSAVNILTINILRNLYRPRFNKTSFDVDVLETQNLGDPIVKVVAFDRDSQKPYNSFTYAMRDKNNAYFHVDKYTGEVSVKSPLTLGNEDSYSFSIIALEEDGNLRSENEARINVRVARNRNCPKFRKNERDMVVNITKTLSTNREVIRLEATDSDPPGPFKNVTYEIIGDGKTAVYFKIDQGSGQIYVQRDLRSDTADVYRVSLTLILPCSFLKLLIYKLLYIFISLFLYRINTF